MYQPFYNLSADAFRLTPDARFCFAHASHTQAHAYLEYALKLGEGIILVTGRPGTGKSTLIDAFINQIEKRTTIAESIAASSLETTELLRAVAYAYGIEAEGLDKAALRRRIEQFFMQHLQAGRRALLVIDEAQGLSHAAIEELRLLSDLHTGARPLLQLFLVGQESLRDVMRSPDIEQFQQRVVGTCRLEPLSLRDTSGYVKHRLLRAGWAGDPQFTGEAIVAIYRHSTGVPRHINKLCTRLLLQGYMEGKHEFGEADVLAIAAEMHEEQLGPLASNLAAFRDVWQPVAELKDGTLSLDELALRADSELSVRRVAGGRPLPGRLKQPTAQRVAPPPPAARHARDSAPVSPAQHRPQAPAARSAAVHRPDTSNRYSARPGEVRLAVKYGALIMVALAVSAMRTWFDSNAGDHEAVFAVDPETPAPLAAQPPTLENTDVFDLETGRQASAWPVTDTRERGAASRQDSRNQEALAVEQVPATVAVQTVPEPPAIQTRAVQPPRDVTPGSTAFPETAAAQQPEPIPDNNQVARADPADPLPHTIAAPVAHPPVIHKPVSPPAAAAFTSREAAEPAAPEPAAEQEPQSQAYAADSGASSPADLRQQKIDDLIARGRRALDEDRLLIPSENNAHNYFREVLSVDPDNPAARDGIEQIVRRYVLFAERALDRHDEEKTRLYIKRGLSVRPNDRRLLSLQGSLNTWLARLEAEARQVIPDLPPPPPLPAESSPRQPNNFVSRLKAFFSQGQNTGQDISVEDRGQPVSGRYRRD